jgi:putative RecB family exonuclease
VTVKLSYSKISTYERCPLAFHLQYEERVPTGRTPALSFGESLHQALHRFHDRPVPVPPSLGELWAILDDVWDPEGYTAESEEAQYRQHARQVLARYYQDNAASYRIPAALEYRFRIEIEGVGVSGVIDRMDRMPGGSYEIIDYKTNRRLPAQAQIDGDLQLSLYALAAREVWGIEPERLTLYYLLPGQRMSTARSPAELDEVRRRVARVAERIEAGRFEPRENALCGWCDFQRLCPIFRHKYEREMSPPRIGEIVDEWIALKREDRARWRRLEELGAIIKAYAEEHDLRRLYGTDAAVSVVHRVEAATDPNAVRRALEPLGILDEVLAIDPKALDRLIQSRTLPPAVEDELLSSREEIRTTKALYLREADRSRR